ncbi:TetR/AcrR family transcriptional regulator [Streptococcus merionis]|uniref:TetR family transcriptional regulator n=1 Tax=Streptococcus merionis TaxID=400065 RepID=A0A239SPW2_9STRE|nr:TetR/AcrR family transcriptional regulator [Streptococcus merionis]SNU86908.1 TetR family transcriptional regulator [Streptococcus merionis]
MPNTKKTKKSTEHLQEHNQEANQITRESLETALLFLMEKKELTKISISELVEKAGVSRNAFYRNYQSKDQMLEGMLEKVIRRMFKEFKTNSKKKTQQASWLSLFQEAKKEAHLLRIAFQHDLEKKISDMVSEFLSKSDDEMATKEDNETNSYLNSFWSSAIVSTLAKWASDGMKVSEEKMANLGLPLFNRTKNNSSD